MWERCPFGQAGNVHFSLKPMRSSQKGGISFFGGPLIPSRHSHAFAFSYLRGSELFFTIAIVSIGGEKQG